MSLNVRGSDSLFWKAGIDTDGLRRDASTVQSIMKMVGTVITGYMVREVMKAAQTQDRALTQLAASYKQAGIYSSGLMHSTIKLANEMQRIANVEDDVVEQNIALMTVIGKLRADQIEPATKAAIGLSKAYGLDLASAFNLVGRAAVGQTQTLARYGIVLKEGAAEQEKFNELMKKGAEGFETAKIQAGDATGQYEKMTLAIGDMKEALGNFAVSDAFASGIKIITYAIQNLTDYLNNLGSVWDVISLKIQSRWLDIAHIIKSAGISQAPGMNPEQQKAAQKKEFEKYEQDQIQNQKYFLNRIYEREKKEASKYDKVPGSGVMPSASVGGDAGTDKESDYTGKGGLYSRRMAAYFTEYEKEMEREKRLRDQYSKDETADFTQSQEWQQNFAVEMAQITEQEIDDNKKAALEKTLKDTRGMNAKQLLDYAKFLQTQAALYGKNDEMRKALLDEAAQAIKDSYDVELEKIKAIGEAYNALGGFIKQFDVNIGKALSDTAEIIKSYKQLDLLAENAVKAKRKLSPEELGNIKAGGLGAATTVMGIMDIFTKQFFSDTDKGLARIARAVEVFDNAIRIVQSDVDKALGEERIAAIEKGYSAIQKRIIELNKALKADPFSKDLQERLALAREELQGMIDEYNELLTGTTAQSIADSIRDGLSQGLDSAEVFADTFNGLMKKALWDAFSRNIMTKMMQPWYDEFANKAQGGLTTEEIAVLKKSFIELSGGVKSAFDSIQSIADAAGISLTETANKTGLAGAIAGVSEETAGLLAGQFNAMRINTVQLIKLVQDGTNTHLLAISNKTGSIDNILHTNYAFGGRLTHINDRLIEVRDATRTMKDYTSVIMSTALDNLRANQETAINTRWLKSIDNKLSGGAGVSVTESPYLTKIRALGF